MTTRRQRPDVRARAYAAGGRIARESIARDAPADAEALAGVEASDIVVVPGSYDHVEMVLDALEMPHTIVEARHFSSIRLRPDQLLVVNCPGHMDARDLRRIHSFVEEGGSLFTTDWALKHVVEPLFPGTVLYNERPTRDDVVRIEIRDHDNPFLRGVMNGADDPQWWLEGSSYPIRVRDPERVQVLIESRELEDRYGEAPVAVLLSHGLGDVFHMISHYYLQRTELRTKRHQADAVAYASEKFDVVAPAMAASLEGLRLGEVESAASSARLFANVVAAEKRRPRRAVRSTSSNRSIARPG